jgi:hypothetical protein
VQPQFEPLFEERLHLGNVVLGSAGCWWADPVAGLVMVPIIATPHSGYLIAAQIVAN